MPPEVVATAVVVTLIAGGLAILESTWKPIRRYVLRRPDTSVATADHIAEVKQKLDEIQEKLAAPSEGTPAVNTDALAAEATAKTEQFLAEAVELQRQHREREAIDCLLEAYRRDLPPEAKAQLHLLAGNGFARLSELKEAESHFRQALTAAEEGDGKRGQADALGNLGIVYGNRGDLEAAEEYYKRSLVIHEETGNKLGQANQFGNLGNVYSRRDNPEKAEEHYRKALSIGEEIGNKLCQANALANLGLIFADRGDPEKAEEYHKQALAIHEEIGNKLGQAADLGNLGIVYLHRGDQEESEEHLRRALDIQNEIGDKLGQARQLGNLGNVYKQRGDLDKAEERYKQALSLFEDIGARPEIAQTQQALEQLRKRRP